MAQQPGTKNEERRTRSEKPLRSSGFSLLELLLAITVLIIIVLVIALVFQQANTAWGSGTRKAGAETTLRGIMGIIEHDLTDAVDGAQFSSALANQWSSSSLTFVTVDGTNRVPQQVTYTVQSSASGSGFDIIRGCQQLDVNPSSHQWEPCSTIPLVQSTLNGTQALSSCTFTPVPASATTGLPLRVEIEAHVKKQGSFAVVSGYSLGQNRSPSDYIVASP